MKRIEEGKAETKENKPKGEDRIVKEILDKLEKRWNDENESERIKLRKLRENKG